MVLTASNDPPRDDSAVVGRFPTADEAVGQFQRTCRAVVDGRRAARLLASWSSRLGLSEPDVQVLWTLRLAAPEGLDQSTLASRLVISPAQVSATVERLRARGWIERLPDLSDRRRNLWQLAADGQGILERVLDEVARLRREAAEAANSGAMDTLIISGREEAA